MLLSHWVKLRNRHQSHIVEKYCFITDENCTGKCDQMAWNYTSKKYAYHLPCCGGARQTQVFLPARRARPDCLEESRPTVHLVGTITDPLTTEPRSFSQTFQEKWVTQQRPEVVVHLRSLHIETWGLALMKMIKSKWKLCLQLSPTQNHGQGK